MKIAQGLIPLVVTITVVWGAEDKLKKSEDKQKKTGVKRQIGYGIEAIPGVAFHSPLADEPLLAIGQPTGHGGYGLVQPVLISTPQGDTIGGFTSQGIDAVHGGFGVYAAPQAYIVSVPQVSKTHQLDGGWKGIENGHGSIKRGHEIAQSLVSKPVAHYQEGVFDVAPVIPVTPQFDFSKARSGAVYNHNALVPMFSGFGPTAKEFAPVHGGNPGHHFLGTSGNGYNFVPTQGKAAHIGPSYHHSAGHVLNHKGHGSVSHGHQLAKKVHSGFIGSHGPKHPTKVHLYNFRDKPVINHATAGKHSPHIPGQHHLHFPAPSRANHFVPAPRLPASSRILPSNDHASHDSTSHSTSYSMDFNSPQSSYSPDFNPSSGSTEFDSPGHTNSHGGHYSSDKKATSFQSFVIHSYKPQQTSHKTKYDSNEGDDNFSGPNYSAQAQSEENHF